MKEAGRSLGEKQCSSTDGFSKVRLSKDNARFERVRTWKAVGEEFWLYHLNVFAQEASFEAMLASICVTNNYVSVLYLRNSEVGVLQSKNVKDLQRSTVAGCGRDISQI